MNTLTPLNVVTTSISAGATTPPAPTGALVYSSTAAALLQFNGSSWQALAGGGGGGGVTSVTATGNLSVANGTTTPAITMLASPSFTNVTASGQFNGSGAGLTNGTVPNAALVSTPVDLTSAQTIGGIKTFSSPPVLSGASMTAGTLAPAALSTAPVLVTGAQTVAGVKTFSSPPVMSGASITSASIPSSALASGGSSSGTPMYSTNGTAQTEKQVFGQATVTIANSFGSSTITLTGSAIFTSAATYGLATSSVVGGSGNAYNNYYVGTTPTLIVTTANASGSTFTLNVGCGTTTGTFIIVYMLSGY